MKKYIYLILIVTLSACAKKDCPNETTCWNMGTFNNTECKCDCVNGYTGVDCLTPPASPCAVQHYGKISIFSSKSDPYEVRVNGSYKGNVGAYGSKELSNFPSGSVYIEVTQASGYIFYPSVYSTNATLSDCYNLNFSF